VNTLSLPSRRVSETPLLDALEPMPRAFVREWLLDFNATGAAKRAGYSPKSAKDKGYQLLCKPEVRAAADELLRVSGGVTRSRVVEEIARIAFADPADVMTVDEDGNFYLRPFRDIPIEARTAIASIKQKPGEHGPEREIKLHDKVAALNLLAKATGLLREAPILNLNTNVHVGVMVAPQVASPEDWEAQMKADQARAPPVIEAAPANA
jgi:phage terminase small subunit